ncbi:MAG: AAA family ATPase [Clostridia bacterium]|nr:AAA family ATPase [Clostridia bacterium]
MKKIFIITGRTGAGKSTLCQRLEEYFNYPLLSFADMGKKFANENGYNRIRECHFAMGTDKFKTKISKHILDTIDKQLKTCDNIIIDGLYIDDAVSRLKENYNCKIIYLKTEDNIRYERISQRLSTTIEQAKKENEIKEYTKDELGIDILIKNTDYVISGSKSADEVFEAAKQFIEE